MVLGLFHRWTCKPGYCLPNGKVSAVVTCQVRFQPRLARFRQPGGSCRCSSGPAECRESCLLRHCHCMLGQVEACTREGVEEGGKPVFGAGVNRCGGWVPVLSGVGGRRCCSHGGGSGNVDQVPENVFRALREATGRRRRFPQSFSFQRAGRLLSQPHLCRAFSLSFYRCSSDGLMKRSCWCGASLRRCVPGCDLRQWRNVTLRIARVS